MNIFNLCSELVYYANFIDKNYKIFIQHQYKIKTYINSVFMTQLLFIM